MIGKSSCLNNSRQACLGHCRKCDELTLIALRRFADELISRTFQVPLGELKYCSRGRAEVALARQMGMYLCHVTFGISMHDVGKLFARDRTTVAHACIVVEDLRDNESFDRTVELLTFALQTAASLTDIE